MEWAGPCSQTELDSGCCLAKPVEGASGGCRLEYPRKRGQTGHDGVSCGARYSRRMGSNTRQPSPHVNVPSLGFLKTGTDRGHGRWGRGGLEREGLGTTLLVRDSVSFGHQSVHFDEQGSWPIRVPHS